MSVGAVAARGNTGQDAHRKALAGVEPPKGEGAGPARLSLPPAPPVSGARAGSPF
jgi:hypothetical protein